MIYSEKYKFIYFAISKTGTTSVEKVLNKYKSDFPFFYNFALWNKHMYPRKAKKLFSQKIWDQCFKFCFIRNPFDRMISGFLSMNKKRREIKINEFNLRNNFRLLEYMRRRKKSKNIYLQSEWIIDKEGNILIDFVGRYENLQDDFNKICNIIGIKQEKLPILNKNKTKHYSLYHNEKSKKMINELYKKDLEKFNYKFEEEK